MRIAIVRSWALRARVIPDPVLAEQVAVSSRIRTPSLRLRRLPLRVAIRDPLPVVQRAHPLVEPLLRRRDLRHATTEHAPQQRNPARRNPARRARALVALLVRVVPNVRVELQERARGRLQAPALAVRGKALREKARQKREPEEKRQPREPEHGARGEEQHRVAEKLGPLRENRLAVGPQRRVARDARPVDELPHAPVAARRVAVAAGKPEQRELS